MKQLYVVALCCMFASMCFAQSDSTKLNAKFRFHDGIYQTAAELKKNKPTLVSADLNKNAIVTDNVIQITTTPQTANLKAAWCIVKEGIPYINFTADTSRSDVQTFYKLQLQGKICYFSYTRNEYKKVPMNVYDPQSGRLIYTSYIQNRERTAYRYMTRLSDGQILQFDRINLMKWAADDKKVVATITDLKEDDELHSRLFKSLLVYNDRNVIWVKK